jgi:succinate dehydrogenase (ubiquinone) membrane anchor subunit
MFTLLIVFFIHCRGIETIVVDYLRPKIVGATVAKMGVALVYLISAFTLGGLFYFNYSDVGIVNAVKLLWKL